MRIATIELHKEELGFSAGHFTIFSATDREDLHGHNYHIHASFRIAIQHNGMAFDYRLYNNKIQTLCDMLDRHFLLAGQSPYLKIEETEDMVLAHYNTEKIPFLKRDVVVLPVVNITIEELAYWFLQQLVQDPHEIKANSIQSIIMRVSNGPGQSGAATWEISHSIS